MTDFDHKNNKAVIADFTENAKIPDTVTPEMTEFIALQGLTDLARIVEKRNPAKKKVA